MKDLGDVIQSIQLTEKASAAAEKQNKYFFKVAPKATKQEIKAAVEQVFKVAVASVNTMQYSGKKKRMRSQRHGQRADWKRAVVALKEGSKIELA